jgi:hypothetical protein
LLAFKKKKKKKKIKEKPGVVGQVCDSSTQDTEAGGLRIQAQPGLHSEPLSTKEKSGENIFCFIYFFTGV